MRTHDEFMADMQPIFDMMAGGPMSKHTPGPWRYEESSRGPEYVTHAHVWGPKVSISTSGNLSYTAPDMRLIAAAPDLLNALQVLADAAASLGIPVDAARAAIAKAKGESHG